jgi:hypothetical protein
MKKLLYVLCLISSIAFAGDHRDQQQICTQEMGVVIAMDILRALERLAYSINEADSKEDKAIIENIVDEQFEEYVSVLNQSELGSVKKEDVDERLLEVRFHIPMVVKDGTSKIKFFYPERLPNGKIVYLAKGPSYDT